MKKLGLAPCMERRQVMAFALHQSLKILQLSEMELAEWVREEIERNPLLEELPRKNSPLLPLLDVEAKRTLREHLFAQMRESLNDFHIAEALIDHLDEKGFLSISLEELPWPKEEVEEVLKVIQTFDPPGIGARNLQESLLLQLQRKAYSLAEIIVRDHFQDLLHSRFQTIRDCLHVSPKDFSLALNQISKLRIRPAEGFDRDLPPQWVPDLVIKEGENGWMVQVGEDELPQFRICEEYKGAQKKCSAQEKETLKSWFISGRWLQRCISRRRAILFKIGVLLLQKRADYFETGRVFKPIRIKELAELLSVHPTTAWRAVANKMVFTPFGMQPLQNFFSDSIAKDPVKELLLRLVKRENKAAPYSDEELSHLLGENGLPCARRTVSKYRKLLKIGSAAQRKVMAGSAQDPLDFD